MSFYLHCNFKGCVNTKFVSADLMDLSGWLSFSRLNREVTSSEFFRDLHFCPTHSTLITTNEVAESLTP